MTAPVVTVTGATRGLGQAISAALAASGAQVVMVCRDPERGESARQNSPAQELVRASR